jgi:hypothetical protein
VSRLTLGPTQPPMQWVAGTLSQEVKWAGHEADHSPPSKCQGQERWSYTSMPAYAFMTVLNQLSTGTILPCSFFFLPLYYFSLWT